ncbi:MAG: choice-of-anchor D domain-containing protein [Ignavibacteria bacterium]|nr:choice-of-anchor D domain-containing protein [Ignavibacteria bacterium]
MKVKIYGLLFMLFTSFSFAQSYHAITIDGNNDFTTASERMQTTSGTSLYSYITWDKNYLYIGLSGNSHSGSVTDGNRVYHLYIDTDPQKNPTEGTGTTAGLAWRNTPTLPFSANYHYAFKTADNTEARDVYSSGSWQNATFATSNWKSTGYWEVRISLADIGFPRQINLLGYVEEDWSGGWLCGGMPSNLFTDNNNGGAITFASHWLNFSLYDQVIPNATYNQDNYSWQLRIKASTSLKTDTSAFAGMAKNATNDYDANVDVAKPPTPPSNYLEVFFPHSNWPSALGPFYSRDIKKLISLDSTTLSWDFTVRTDNANTNVTLATDFLASIPANYPVAIQDISADSIHNVRVRGNYVYNSGVGGDKYFRLIIGTSLSAAHITSSSAALNFGSLKIGKDSSITVTLGNSGDSLLTITNIVSSLSAFTFSGATTYNIPHNATVPVTVKFLPVAAQAYSGSLKVYSNDRTTPELQISLSGSGYALTSNIAASTTSLNLGQIKVDFDTTASFKLYNSGDTTLVINGMSSSTGRFSVVGNSAISINKKDSATVQVKFTPLAVSTYTDTLVIANNSANAPVYKIALSGSGKTVTVAHSYTKGWNLISVPVSQQNASAAAVIGDNIASFSLFAYANGAYVTADSVFAGKAYWLGLESNGSFDVTGAPKTGNVTQSLSTGWNLIASPYVRNYQKNVVQFKRGTVTVSADSAVSLGWIQNTYYTYRQSDSSYTSANELAQWSGYFSAGLKDSVQAIFIHDSAGVAVAKSLPAPVVDNNNWIVNLSVKENGLQDNLVSFGVAANATAGFDARYDLAKPPTTPVASAPEAYFVRSNWSQYFTKYSADIREPLAGNAAPEWSFVVNAKEAGSVTISWPNILAQVPAEIRSKYRFELRGNGISSAVNMLQYASYSYQATQGTSTFYINATPTAVNEHPVKAVAFALEQNYPNPFNPSTRIVFSLPSVSKTRLVVYNTLGQVVADMLNTTMAAGRHEVTFDATGLPSGVYIYKLEAEGFSAARKMLLVR